MKTDLAGLVVWVSFVFCMGVAIADAAGLLEPSGALCSTDTECMEHCPPPADDPECDGGPQPAYVPMIGVRA